MTTTEPTVADVAAAPDRRYPPAWAEPWDRVGLVLVAHHPLLLRGVSSVAPTTYKGRIVHQLIKRDVALYVAHTNADVAGRPGRPPARDPRRADRGLRRRHRSVDRAHLV